MNFVLVLAAPINTIGVTTTQLHMIAQAVTVQLDRDLSPHWGGSHMVRVGESPSPEILPGEIAFALVDELPSTPGAVAYHDVQGNGVAVAFEALSMCNSVLTGPDSVSVAISHECCETVGNPSVNLWADDGRGNEWAHELCDAVEAFSYTINGLDVSDFLLPSFFDVVGTAGPYSFGGHVSMPSQTGQGGYQIHRTSGTNEGQVTALHSDAPHILIHGQPGRPLHAAKREHWSSRSGRLRALVPRGMLLTPGSSWSGPFGSSVKLHPAERE